MTPVYRESTTLPPLDGQSTDAETKKPLDVTLDAYEVEELSERDLGRYLAEIIFSQIAVEEHRYTEAVEEVYCRELAMLV